MNAKVGSDNAGRKHVMGAEGMGTINENGEFFVDFCELNDLVIGETVFPHHKIRQEEDTRRPGGEPKTNQQGRNHSSNRKDKEWKSTRTRQHPTRSSQDRRSGYGRHRIEPIPRSVGQGRSAAGVEEGLHH